MTTVPDLQNRLFATVATMLAVPLASIGPASSRENLAAWDSLKHMHLMLALEESFGVEFDDHELADLNSVQALLDSLAGKLAARS
jgi:acyl carrier protein